MIVFTAEQMRAEEKRGFADGISYEQMMREAGDGVAKKILAHRPRPKHVCVLCGKGRNGGDGFVCATRMALSGNCRVYIILADERPTDELAEKMLREARRIGVYIQKFAREPQTCADIIAKSDCLVDAVFGIGFSGSLRGSMCKLAQLYNEASALHVAVDIPSGLSADSSDIPELYFHADETVTMHVMKRVHVLSPTREACGKTSVVSIGFRPAPKLYTAMCIPSVDWVAARLPRRSRTAHKGDFGYALCIAGSYRMPGAAFFAARACVESGAGLTALAFPDRAYSALTARLSEPIFVPCPSDADGFFGGGTAEVLSLPVKKSTAILFGCGAGTSEGARAVLEFLLKKADCPLLLDADGINLLGANIHVLKECGTSVILTPHPGEMARLTGMSAEDINADRIGVASRFAVENGVTVLLKGSGTVIAGADGAVYVNPNGNPGMATGGSGDLLSGIILSLLAQGVSPVEAAVCGAFIHGAAGDAAADRYSQMGTTPTRMLETLPVILSQIEKVM